MGTALVWTIAHGDNLLFRQRHSTAIATITSCMATTTEAMIAVENHDE
jgi:hypothetical protein